MSVQSFPLHTSVSVRRHRQHPHQPRHPQPDDRREQVGHRAHAGLSGSVLQLLVWHHSTGQCQVTSLCQILFVSIIKKEADLHLLNI